MRAAANTPQHEWLFFDKSLASIVLLPYPPSLGWVKSTESFILLASTVRRRCSARFIGFHVPDRFLFIMAFASAAVLSLISSARPLPAAPRLITINMLQAGKVFRSPLNVCIGGEHAALEFNRESLRQLAIAHRLCGFSYIRFHGILNPAMQTVRRVPNGKLLYNWQRVDRLYAELLHAGVKPIVELSFMPKALASGTATCFYYKGNITPPRHYRQWGDMIGSMVRNLEKRFGRREVRSWYFEVWNEPNYGGFSTVGFKGYLKLYAAAARAINAVDPKLRVGGPASAGMAWISRFIKACYREHIPLNFISCHTYGCGPHKWADGKKGLRVAAKPNAIAGGIHWTQERILHSPMPHLPLLITEWGPSYSSRDAVHDTYFQAVWLLEQVHTLKPSPMLMSYWSLSDIFDEDGPQLRPFEGGFGIFNPQGIPKPTFFAMEFLHELQGRELVTHDSQSIAVTHDNGVHLMAWDYAWPDQSSRDDSFYQAPHPSAAASPIALTVEHLKRGRYELRIYREGYRHNDAYTLYQKWGHPAHLTPNQLRQLHAEVANQPVLKKIVSIPEDGQFKLAIPMRTNGIILLKLKPLG